MFIIREINSDMPIYILTEQMSEKIKCPERDSNPRHHDLMEGALTTELPRQPQWSELNVSYKGTSIFQTFAPRPHGLGITSVDRQDPAHRTRCCRSYTLNINGIFRTMFIIREINSDMPIYILTEQMSEKSKKSNHALLLHYMF